MVREYPALVAGLDLLHEQPANHQFKMFKNGSLRSQTSIWPLPSCRLHAKMNRSYLCRQVQTSLYSMPASIMEMMPQPPSHHIQPLHRMLLFKAFRPTINTFSPVLREQHLAAISTTGSFWEKDNFISQQKCHWQRTLLLALPVGWREDNGWKLEKWSLRRQTLLLHYSFLILLDSKKLTFIFIAQRTFRKVV